MRTATKDCFQKRGNIVPIFLILIIFLFNQIGLLSNSLSFHKVLSVFYLVLRPQVKVGDRFQNSDHFYDYKNMLYRDVV